MQVPAVPGNEAVARLIADARTRWQAVDPLLPVPVDPLLPVPAASSAPCAARLAVRAGDGLVATGSCEHWQGEPDSLDTTWGAARRFELTPLVAGPDVAGALDALLAQWRDHLVHLPAAGAADTAAVVNWPSRDIDGPAVLLRHGFAPLAVIAAKSTAADRDRMGDAAAAEPPPGMRIRRAGPADLDTVVRLGLEVIRFDAHFCGVQERPSTAAALARDATVLLGLPRPWVWLAEGDGAVVGMLAAEQPEQASWIAPMTAQSPVCYLLLQGVSAPDRARGIGAALAARLARAARAAGVGVILLHYAQVNPLSAPFWSQQGYRPLWTIWEAWPPAAVR
jgi:GNAT superfamily N-acetyltransferase